MVKWEFIKRHKNEFLIALGLLCALILLLSSGCTEEVKEGDDMMVSEYADAIEKRLKSLISRIDGAGNTEVMVIMDSGVEYVYARDSETNDNTEKTEYFTDGDKRAVIVKEITPRVRGVAVVCDGGDSLTLKQKIISLVSSLLDISSTRIFVSS